MNEKNQNPSTPEKKTYVGLLRVIKEMIEKIKKIFHKDDNSGDDKGYNSGDDKGYNSGDDKYINKEDIIANQHMIDVFTDKGKIIDETVRQINLNKGEIIVTGGGNPIIMTNKGIVKVTDARARIVTNKENGLIQIENENENERKYVTVGTNEGTIEINKHGRLILENGIIVFLNSIIYPYEASNNSFFEIKKEGKKGKTLLKIYKENGTRKIKTEETEKEETTPIQSIQLGNGEIKVVLETSTGKQYIQVKNNKCIIKGEKAYHNL